MMFTTTAPAKCLNVLHSNCPFQIINNQYDKNNMGENNNSRRKQFEINHNEYYP